VARKMDVHPSLLSSFFRFRSWTRPAIVMFSTLFPLEPYLDRVVRQQNTEWRGPEAR